MPTRLGLYGGPTGAAGGSVLTAESLAVSINIELVDGTPVSSAKSVHIELVDGTPVSRVATINIETIDPQVTAGSPDSILNLPPSAVASRLRADFYAWRSANPASLVSSNEYIAEKLGSAPLLSISNFEYTNRLSAMGDWTITVPIGDNKLGALIDEGAQIIKVYYEGVGLVFTGWISTYSIANNESLEIQGYDLLVLMARAASLWRVTPFSLSEGVHRKNFFPNPWYFIFTKLIKTFCSALEVDFEALSTVPKFSSWTQVRQGLPSYQDQSILEVARDLGDIGGNSFRINPATGVVTFGLFGDDSGIVISEFQNDDVEIREEGGLAIVEINYDKSDEDLVNFLIPQGSNDSFGVAVELRHVTSDSSADAKRFTEDGDSIDDIQIPYGNPRIWDSQPLVEFDSQSGQVIGEGHRYGYKATTPTEFGEANAARYNLDHDAFREDDLFTVSFTPGLDFYLTFIAALNLGGVGDVRLFFRGGVYTDWIQFHSTNWDVDQRRGWAQMPGFEPESPYNIFTGQEGSVDKGIQERWPDVNLRRAQITEVLAFMNIPREPGDNTPPWPLCEAGVSYQIKFDSTITAFTEPGVPELLYFTAPIEERQAGATEGTIWGGHATRPRWAKRLTSNDPVIEISGWPVDSPYPYAIEGMAAPNAGGNDNDTGHRLFFLRDFESIRQYGLRQKVVSFETAFDNLQGVGAIHPMSDLLNDMAQVYLARHKDPLETISITVTGAFRLPKVGQKARVVYRGVTKTETDDFKWIDINGLYYVTGITWSISDEGIMHTFELSNIPENATADLLTQNLIKTSNRINTYLSEYNTGLNRIGRRLPRFVSVR